MYKISKFVVLAILTTTVFIGCSRNELNIDNLSKEVKISREIAAPLAYGDVYLLDLLNSDVIITIEGDTTLTDTFEFSISDDQTEGFELEYFTLYHETSNYLPVGIDISIITYDSISGTTLDKIRFVDEGQVFLPAASLDADTNIIEDLVVPTIDSLEITSSVAENLLNVATHVILEINFLSESTNVIEIKESHRISFDFGFKAKGSLTKDLADKKDEDQQTDEE
ncbi:MAG: hypothetical protein JXA77_00550 [Bacteroidales bacterium]|nr:hypothetical protein [Bacteroidales bacterium]MBN2817663.1 hypothetical protein [Bacteroidales bacterium]